MRRLFSFAALVALASAVSARDTAKPRLKFTQDGKDLVVQTVVTANAAPHVLWTHVIDLGDEVVLRYYVIQNSDTLVRDGVARSRKDVEVEWRVPNATKAGKKFRVERVFEPNTEELNALLPKLQRLVEEGAKWKFFEAERNRTPSRTPEGIDRGARPLAASAGGI